jgi:hypothetical protein
VLKGNPHIDYFRSDCFSLGVVMHIVQTRTHPFGRDPHKRDSRILEGDDKRSIEESLGRCEQQLLLRLLSINPLQRPASAEEVLEDPFFGRAASLSGDAVFSAMLIDTVEFLEVRAGSTLSLGGICRSPTQ